MGLLGTLIGNRGVKKAAKYQLAGMDKQIAEANANRDFQYGINKPTIDAGTAASGLISAFTGASGDPAAAASALDTYRGSTGYQDLLDTGFKAINSNAYAHGAGKSGATLLRLQEKGQSLADQSAQGWVNNLGSLATLGANAMGRVAGVGQTTVNTINQATQTGADAQSNAALIKSGNWVKLISQLEQLAAGGAGGGGFASTGSSFGFGR